MTSPAARRVEHLVACAEREQTQLQLDISIAALRIQRALFEVRAVGVRQLLAPIGLEIHACDLRRGQELVHGRLLAAAKRLDHRRKPPPHSMPALEIALDTLQMTPRRLRKIQALSFEQATDLMQAKAELA
jgi:hypothetical protein